MWGPANQYAEGCLHTDKLKSEFGIQVGKIKYQDLRVLIADDFSNFRNTVNGILLGMDIEDISMAATGKEVIELCKHKNFDLVICDYNLGEGRNGQQVLEELRFTKKLSHASSFIIVSAESSRNIVMSAYDCEPDDYLMKPITAMMLQTRINRLLKQKTVLRPVYEAIASDDKQLAMDLLIDMTLAEDRYSTLAQKMLGGLFIETGDLQKAEKLYTKALEVRPVDWARLGLAQVKHLQDDYEQAGEWLSQIVDENPLYLPAYDVLADNWGKKGDREAVQKTMKQAVDVSPMSILRQKRLAKIANANEDVLTSAEALKNAIKLGRLSCYGSPDDSFEYARTIAMAKERNLDVPENATRDAMHYLFEAQNDYVLKPLAIAQMNLVQGRVYANSGEQLSARACLKEALQLAEGVETSIDFEVDRLAILLALEEKEEAEDLIEHLKHRFQNDQKALQKLDQFLTEPVSDLNRDIVTQVNREGIDLYSVGEYDQALECFEKARKLFPKHIGIQLNIVQSLVGKLKIAPDDEEVLDSLRKSLRWVESLLDKDHKQYARYARLKRRADVFLN